MKFKISEKNLEKAVEHIIYEISMFRFAVHLLNQPKNQQEYINVFLEIFAIHARNLYYFFYTDDNKRRKDDILAIDYIKMKQEFKNKRTPKNKLKIIEKKANKQIAHLTYTRLRYNKLTKPWKIADIYVKMNTTINEFYNTLSEKRKKWFV